MMCKYCFGEAVKIGDNSEGSSVCLACGAVNSAMTAVSVLELMKSITERALVDAVQDMRIGNNENSRFAAALSEI